MRIAIIGAGRVGVALGRHWAKTSHVVRYGLRNPGDPKHHTTAEKLDGHVRFTSPAEAVELSEVVLLAVPWNAVPDVLQACGDLDDKILIDCTNPVKQDLTGLTIGHTTSAAEQIAKWAPSARVVKAFNTVGSAVMENPQFGERTAIMPICGDDAEAKKLVSELAEQVGFESLDAGPLVQARLLESMAMLWIYLAVHRGQGTDFAWELLRR